MTITLAESGLTEAEWEALGALVEDAVFDVTLYAWQPQFTPVIADDTHSHNFDAVLHDGLIYWLAVNLLTTLDGASTSYSPPTGAAALPPSLVSEGDLYVFAVTSTGISRNSYNGATWAGWTEIVTDATVAFIGATDADTCHFVTLDAENHYHFCVALNDVGWTVSESDIYWGFPLLSFSAKRLGTKDVLAFVANLPGTPSTRTEGTEVVKYILPTGAVCAMTYQYGSWSDHIDLDHVDSWSNFRFRDNLCLSLIDDTLWLTCASSEGTAKTPIEGLRVYNSTDGLHWSRGELLSFERDPSQGLLLLREGTTLYALGSGALYSAPSTLWFGVPDSSTILDLSPYVHRLSDNRRDMQQVGIVVDNSGDWVETSILNGEVTCALQLKTGFWMGSARVTIPVGLFEVDSVEPAQEQPDRMVQISARDRMAWMTSKTQSEQFVNWLPQGLGIDQYVDADNSGYGGMTHTAPVDGSWKAYGNLLRLTSNDKEGIAYSTFLHDCWNGSVQSYFDLAISANNKYAGLIFRFQDKDNTFAYYYNVASDTLRLEHWVAGTRSLLWESAAKGWGPSTAKYLRADFRYSRIRLYSSNTAGAENANITWALEQSLLVDGHTSDANLESGYVGVLGKGFSDLDAWSSTPDPIGAGDLPWWWDPYIPHVWSPPNLLRADYDKIAAVLDGGVLIRTGNFTDATPNWTAISLGTGTVYDVLQSPFELTTLLVLTATNIYRVTNIHATPVVTDVFAFRASAAHVIQYERGLEGFAVVATNYIDGVYVTRTLDGGQTWSAEVLVGMAVNLTSSGYARAALEINGHTNAVYVAAHDGAQIRLYKSSDFAASFAITADYEYLDSVPTALFTAYHLLIPWDDPSVLFHGHKDGNSTAGPTDSVPVVRSTSAAASSFALDTYYSDWPFPRWRGNEKARWGLKAHDGNADWLLLAANRWSGAGGSESYLYRSLDGGTTVEAITGGSGDAYRGCAIGGDGIATYIWGHIGSAGIWYAEPFTTFVAGDLQSKKGDLSAAYDGNYVLNIFGLPE